MSNVRADPAAVDSARAAYANDPATEAHHPRVVAVGGGTGLSTLLRGLKHLTPNITAVVTVADDGGSSGRLRADLGVPPPGDIRDCLLALADHESLLASLFSHRFASGELAGHSVGNLLLAALTEVLGDFDKAVKESSKVLAITGMVLPGTTSDVRLHALLSDGRHLVGESRIGRSPVSVSRVWLEPEDAQALPLALARIGEADLVVLGPGSLFTSVMPNLLLGGMREALASTEARVVYVANVMTQPGETASFTGRDHLAALIDHLGQGVLDAVLVNSTPVPDGALERYGCAGAEPVTWPSPPHKGAGDGRDVFDGVALVRRDLLRVSDHVRHDPQALAAEVLALCRGPAR
ncbi:MAG TPA: uridine diphosphate-N-acetylglucosamine-binding protein YvcK [Thermoleophilia bacterium]|nr:uridine diphosphate-N-acetylglucosamine-binding protein YvcK [Thermoleophilia bacterium]